MAIRQKYIVLQYAVVITFYVRNVFILLKNTKLCRKINQYN